MSKQKGLDRIGNGGSNSELLTK